MRLRHRRPARAPLARPLKPWILAAGVLVSFTAGAGIRTTVEPGTPGLRFEQDPVSVSLAWPTLTAPDIALHVEDFMAPRGTAPEAMQPLEIDPPEEHALGFWRGAQPWDGQDGFSEATPEVSVLFRLDPTSMPARGTFTADARIRAAFAPLAGTFNSEDDAALTVAALPQAAQAQTPTTDPRVVGKPIAKGQDKLRDKAQDRIGERPKSAPASEPVAAEPLQRLAALPPSDTTVITVTPSQKPAIAKSPLLGVVTSERELKCLAEAVYYEARSEPERGQAGVAQVVLNRVRSGVYPASVCGVVYQNRHRYLACQFTFACEGKALRITEPGPWRTAMRIAKDVAEGRTYLPGVGNATHYHANYVRPWWARHMDRREKVGKHIFYFEEPEN
jgi:spore germination cell wall hydrolase CwlJ-like protein